MYRINEEVEVEEGNDKIVEEEANQDLGGKIIKIVKEED